MDFSFVATQSQADWREWYGKNVTVDDDGLSLTLEAHPRYVSPRVVVESEDGFTPVDVAIDECDTLYVLAREGGVYRYETETDYFESVADRDDLAGRRPRAICVTRDTIYIADGRREDPATPTKGRLQAISRHDQQTRWTLDAPFENPIGLATDGTVVYVADAQTDGTSGALVPVTADGTGADDDRIVVPDTPRDVAVDPAETPLVLARGTDQSAVHRVDTANKTTTEVVQINHETDETVLPAAIESEDPETILVGADERTTGERVLFRFCKDEPEPTSERLASFKGSCEALLLRRGDPGDDRTDLYLINGKNNDIYVLDAEHRVSRNTDTGRYDGYVGTVLDAEEQSMAWHRGVLDVHGSTVETRVQLRAFATDVAPPGVETINGIGSTYTQRLRDANVTTVVDLATLDPERTAAIADATVDQVASWHAEASARIASEWEQHDDHVVWEPSAPGDEAPDAVASRRGRRQRTGTQETIDTLFEGARGRYLWVRINVLGTESTTPTLQSFRAYFPRQSYLRYLPAVFQEDEQSAAFLERFLSIFESVFTDVEEQIETSTRFLDAGGIPEQYLSWLGEWLALEADETWDEDAMRSFLRQAPSLYKQRGTRDGLLAVIELFLDFDDLRPHAWECALERETQYLDERVARGELTAAEAAADLERLATPIWLFEYADIQCVEDDESVYERIVPCPQCFIVFVPPFVDDERLRTVRRIVETQTPAHAVGRAVRLGASIQLSGPEFAGHSYLGMNTVLSEGEYVVGEADLGGASRLAERESHDRLESQSSPDEDTTP
mgnify:FL=1